MSTNNYVDVIVGGGYDWGRIEQDDVRVGPFEERQADHALTFAKAGLGYNYLTPDYTVRLEVGARYSSRPTASSRSAVKAIPST